MARVGSIAVETINYHGESRTLFVKFTSGESYAYFGVPASVYDGFINAPSKGRYFFRHVRGRYPYHHVR